MHTLSSPGLLVVAAVYLLLALLPIRGTGQNIDSLKKSAEQGNAKAQYYLGVRYIIGRGVSKDFTKGEYWLTKGAEQENSDCQYMLGEYYLLNKDYSRAFYWIEKAVKKSNINAINRLGKMYLKGNGVDINKNKAKVLFERSVQLGSIEGMYLMAEYYFDLCIEDEDPVSGLALVSPLEVVQEIIKHESPFHQYTYWLTKAAENGYPTAERVLGIRYELNKNYEAAKYWYSKAADQNDWVACNKLAILYFEGKGVSKNLNEAYRYWSKAYDLNHQYIDVIDRLIVCYENGYGTNPDYSKAILLKNKLFELKNKNN